MPNQMGGLYTVVSRGHTEKIVKNELISAWKVSLRNNDGHTHSITSKSADLWKQYPMGAELELNLGKDAQQKLAVEKVREKTGGKSSTTEGEE